MESHNNKKNWALVIGVNEYECLQSLNYAKRDAELMQDFLSNKVGFQKVFFFSDNSPIFNGKSTRPTRSNLRRVLRELFPQTEPPKMGVGDNFWFFFSGHGMRHNNCDYLMPSDANPADIEETAISINFVTECLRSSGASNVVLILDACRNQGSRFGKGIGDQTAEIARQMGLITIFSCSPDESCYEFKELEQGAFTYALLEALGIKGRCATVEQLNQYLRRRVPEIVREYNSRQQTPYIIAEPINKSHLILIPEYATPPDIATLKNDAYRAKEEGDIDLAEQLWCQVIDATSGKDVEAIKMVQKIALTRSSQNNGAQNHTPNNLPVKRGLESEPPTSEPLLVPQDNFSPKKLSAQQLQKLQDAFIDAFSTIPSLQELLTLLASELNKNLDIVAAEGNLATYASNLIKTAEGWIENLIFIARELNLGNSKLRDIAQELLTYEQKVLKQKILILLTIPHHWLLNKEIQEIEQVIRQAANQDLFEICVRTAVCPYDIHEVVEKEQPQIVHLCGHGMKDGKLLLEDNEGNNKPVSPDGLASLFKLHATIKCLLLNTYYSQLPAEAISQHIHYVISLNQSIKDKAAILFAQKFYNMLSSDLDNQHVFQKAFDEALNIIKLENVSQKSIPVVISTGAPS